MLQSKSNIFCLMFSTSISLGFECMTSQTSAEWTFAGSERSWIYNQSLNIWPMISFCCSNKRMFLLIYFIQRSTTVLSCSWIIYNFALAFPNFRHLSSQPHPHHAVPLQYPAVFSGIWTTIGSSYGYWEQSPSWNTSLPFDRAIFIKLKCRNHLSLMVLLIPSA